MFLIPASEVMAAVTVRHYTLDNDTGITGTATATVTRTKGNYTVTVKIRDGIPKHQYQIIIDQHLPMYMNPIFLDDSFSTNKFGNSAYTAKGPISDFYYMDWFISDPIITLSDVNGTCYSCQIDVR